MNKSPRIYGSRWDRERLIFLRTHPLCVMCHEQGRVTAATVVDHIIPHKLKEALNSGNAEAIAKAQKLFWSRKNWQGCVSSTTTLRSNEWRNAVSSWAVTRTVFHLTVHRTGSDDNNSHMCGSYEGGGRVKSSQLCACVTARPPLFAQPRNEKFFSGRFRWQDGARNRPT